MATAKTLERGNNPSLFLGFCNPLDSDLLTIHSLIHFYVQFYEKDGKKLPGKKGISLTEDQYDTLKTLVAGGHIDKQIKKIKK